ncbi:MAG: AarF/UbiB family protein, partial [Clostridia bacterium]
MSNFISALMKQRKDAKKEEPKVGGRLKEVLAVLKKYNYDDGITPEIVVNILTDLGPTFVKIGQIASQQAEYLPREYCDALATLRSRVAPMDFETVNAQVEKYLGKPISELYASFSEKPLGSASIAQVHRAELFNGTVVAVKVRRPGIVDTVARDFALIEKILDQFVKKPVKGLDLKGFVTELEKTSMIELDLTNEANNLDRFWKNNSGREKV